MSRRRKHNRFSLITSNNRFLDGLTCTCGRVKDEIQLFACEFCSDNVCGDCFVACKDCGKITCHDCLGDKRKDLCCWCEWDSAKMFSPKPYQYEDLVFLMIDGAEYPVSNRNGNAGMLIELTDPFMAREKHPKLDIKGLGLLQYRWRSIISTKNSKTGMAYHLYCEQLIEV